MAMVIDRSRNVAASLPIPAITFGAQVENSFGRLSSPSQRMTQAVSRVCPLLRMPRMTSSLSECVCLIDDECWMVGLDIAEDGGGRDVAGKRGARTGSIQQCERRRFATAHDRAGEHQERRDVGGVDCPCVQRPQCHGCRTMIGKDGMLRVCLAQRIEQI